MLAVVMAGCSAAGSASGLPVRTDLHEGVRVLAAESTDGTHGNAVAAVGDPRSLKDAWIRFGLAGDPPEVDFERDVVLIYAAQHADCPHAVVSLDNGETLPPLWGVRIERDGDCPLVARPLGAGSVLVLGARRQRIFEVDRVDLRVTVDGQTVADEDIDEPA